MTLLLSSYAHSLSLCHDWGWTRRGRSFSFVNFLKTRPPALHNAIFEATNKTDQTTLYSVQVLMFSPSVKTKLKQTCATKQRNACFKKSAVLRRIEVWEFSLVVWSRCSGLLACFTSWAWGRHDVTKIKNYIFTAGMMEMNVFSRLV